MILELNTLILEEYMEDYAQFMLEVSELTYSNLAIPQEEAEKIIRTRYPKLMIN